jgi:hypothetical protein
MAYPYSPSAAFTAALGVYAPILWRKGFRTMDQLRTVSDEEFLAMRGIGIGRLAGIRAALGVASEWQPIRDRGGP